MISRTKHPVLRRLWATVLTVMCGLLLAVTACGGSQAPAENRNELTDLSYADVSDKQALDLYLPKGKGPFPLVLYIHGGGFILGDKTERAVDEIRTPLLDEGYALASINYRLTDEAGFPAQIHDVKVAVRWLRSNASRFRLNSSKVAVWGASAGGNLATLLGTSCKVESLEGSELGNPDQSSCVQAVINWYGPIDLLTIEPQLDRRSCPNTNADGDLLWLTLYVRGPLEENQDLVRAANPITYITPDDPPVLIQHGTADCNVPPEQSQILAEAFQLNLGEGSVILEYKEGAVHYDPVFVSPSNVRIVLDFLNSRLKQPDSTR